MGCSTVRSDGASIRPSSWELLRSAFSAISANISITTTTTGVDVTITMLTPITASIMAAISGTTMAATSGIAISDTAAPFMERKVACMAPWPAEAANTLEAEGSMVAAEAEASMVAAEATTKTRNIGETKVYNGNAPRGAGASRVFLAMCEQ